MWVISGYFGWRWVWGGRGWVWLVGGKRGEVRELFGERGDGLGGLPGVMIGAGGVHRVVGRIRNGVLALRRIRTRRVRGVLWVVLVIVLVLVALQTGTGARWGVATSLVVTARGRRRMWMAVDGRDGVRVRMAGVSKVRGRGKVGRVGRLRCSHGRCARRRGKCAGRRRGQRGRTTRRAHERSIFYASLSRAAFLAWMAILFTSVCHNPNLNFALA